MYLSCLRNQEINSPKEVFTQAPFNLPLAICSFKNKTSPSDTLQQNHPKVY